MSNITDIAVEERLPIVPVKTLAKTRKYIISRMQQTQKFPAMDWLSKKVGISHAKISVVMKVLLAEGFLLKKGNRYILSDSALDSFESVSAAAKLKANLKLSPGVIILKAVIFIIGSGAACMSVYHSTGFLSDFYAPALALGCAIIMIAFNIISAELAIIFHIKRNVAAFRLFATILVLGTLFSMFSTVLGLYTSRSKDLAVTIVEKNNENHALQSSTLRHQNIVQRKEQKSAEMTSKQLRVDTLIPIVAAYTEASKKENSKLFDDDNYRLIIANRDLKRVGATYDKILEEEKLFLASENVVDRAEIAAPKDAYLWVGEAIGMDADKLQFIISTYPAIFYDIIAPVSFSIVLFLTDTSKKKKPRKRRKNKRGRK